MTREEYNEILATEPATPNQIGAVLGEFARLGLDAPDDRSRRLAVSATIIGLDDLASTADLTMGQAGRLVKALRSITDRSGLPDAGQSATRQPAARTVAEALAQIIRDLAAAIRRL